MKNKKCRKLTLVTFSQSVFLNVKFFLQNRLLSYAGACSFSFLFSFIPVLLLIIIVLVRILHASPETVTSIFKEIPELSNMPSESIIKNVQAVHTIGIFELLIGAFVFWMARRFFASIFDSMQNIFHTQAKRKAMQSQILTLGVEVISVCVVAAVIFAYISLSTLLEMPLLAPFFRKIPALSFFFNGIFLATFIKNLPDILIFAVVLTMYKTASGTKPRFRLCILAAFLCTFSFGIFRNILHLFLNSNNYNLIYGMLGQVIITFMDIFFFFTFFLFFAQYIFTCQFFDELLLGELYLLPKKEGANKFTTAKLLLFIRPDFLLAENEDVLTLQAGQTLFEAGEKSDCAFYVVNGDTRAGIF